MIPKLKRYLGVWQRMPSLAIQLLRAGHYRAALIDLPKGIVAIHLKHVRRLIK